MPASWGLVTRLVLAERARFSLRFASKDAGEALRARLEKRAPRSDGPDGPGAGHEERFRNEGRGLIAAESRRPTLPASATFLQRRAFDEIERSQRFWTALPAQ